MPANVRTHLARRAVLRHAARGTCAPPEEAAWSASMKRGSRHEPLVCVWEFRVKAESVADFERVYGPDGDWARLFRRDPGYMRTELLKEVGDPRRFLTIDNWRSREDYERFQVAFAVEYAALDAACAAYTLDERLIGQFAATD
jgi:heme-degrading monooxygenase HmoA